jgi:hypothetical protein
MMMHHRKRGDVMAKSILRLTIALLVLPAAVHGQSAVTGKWQGKTPNGFQLELDLIATEDDLTGTFTRNGQPITITQGKVSKNTFTFKVTMNSQTEGFTGEINGDQIKVWMDRQGPSAAAALKRVADLKPDVETGLTGKWQGTTASGRPLVLDLQVNGQQLTGRLTLAQQPAEITQGKVEGQTFSFTATSLEGRPIVAKGRLAGEDLELTVQGVGSPLTLKRVK